MRFDSFIYLFIFYTSRLTLPALLLGNSTWSFALLLGWSKVAFQERNCRSSCFFSVSLLGAVWWVFFFLVLCFCLRLTKTLHVKEYFVTHGLQCFFFLLLFAHNLLSYNLPDHTLSKYIVTQLNNNRYVAQRWCNAALREKVSQTKVPKLVEFCDFVYSLNAIKNFFLQE